VKVVGELFNLPGKVAAVVGGAGYLCSALTRAMYEAGMEVVVLDIAEPSRFGLPELSQPIAYVRCDVTAKDELVRCRDEILRRYGRVDVLLNGAGTNAPTPFFDISAEEIQRIIGVNLVGTIYSCQVFGELMVAQRAGSIINFASASSCPPLSKAFIYSVSKAGVVNITQNLAIAQRQLLTVSRACQVPVVRKTTADWADS
jgi:NAD(P)-dependent dehydrogenase (short-subunit alcohol dehydrogenase family)